MPETFGFPASVNVVEGVTKRFRRSRLRRPV